MSVLEKYYEENLYPFQDGVLNIVKKSDIPWYLILSIGPDCLARRGVVCSVCADQCDTRAIRFKPTIGSVALPETDQSLCSGCGACIQACPSKSMYLSKQLSAEGTSI